MSAVKVLVLDGPHLYSFGHYVLITRSTSPSAVSVINLLEKLLPQAV